MSELNAASCFANGLRLLKGNRTVVVVVIALLIAVLIYFLSLCCVCLCYHIISKATPSLGVRAKSFMQKDLTFDWIESSLDDF